jgi:hypothetical protein
MFRAQSAHHQGEHHTLLYTTITQQYVYVDLPLHQHTPLTTYYNKPRIIKCIFLDNNKKKHDMMSLDE